VVAISFNEVETITCFGPRRPSSEGTQHLRNSELLSFLAKSKNPSNTECYTPTSEPFRIYVRKCFTVVQQFQPITITVKIKLV
jgi:hypothetical protein